jgi:hypothetical protein
MTQTTTVDLQQLANEHLGLGRTGGLTRGDRGMQRTLPASRRS